MIALKLSQIAEITDGKLVGNDVTITAVETDSRKEMADALFVVLKGERFDAHDFVSSAKENGAVAALVEKNIDGMPQVIVEDSLIALQQIAVFQKSQMQAKTVAITGSCGKTTVKTLLDSILSECGKTASTPGNFNNHIGVPLTILGMDGDEDFAVIELGANHVGEIAEMVQWAKPNVAVVSMVAGAHLEGFGSFENIIKAKGEIYQGLSDSDVAVVPVTMQNEPQWQGELKDKRTITFGFDKTADIYAEEIEAGISGSSFKLTIDGTASDVNLGLTGKHNVYNALAASACAWGLGTSFDQIVTGLEKAQSVNGRNQIKTINNDIVLINDSYNANQSSFEAGIDLLGLEKGKTPVVIMGDMGELGEQAEEIHSSIGHYAIGQNVEKFIGIGTLSKNAVAAFGNEGIHFDDKQSFKKQIKTIIPKSSVILVKGSRAAAMEEVCQWLGELAEGELN